MPEYVPYFGITALMRRLQKEYKITINNYYERLLEAAYDCLRMEKYADFFTAMVEANHYFMSHRVVLLGKNLAEMLYHSKISVELDKIHLPFSTFELDFDKTMKVPDTNWPVPSVLCSFCDSQASLEFSDRFCTDLYKKYNFPEVPRIKSPKRLVTFRMADTKGSDPISRPMLVFNIDADLCKSMEVDTLINEAPFLKTADEPLNEQDQKIVKTVVKLTLGALCYLNLDNREVEKMKSYNRPRMGIPPNVILLGRKCPSSAFMRSGHMRTLRHQRYKREEDGSYRVIWVREHQVNAEGDMTEREARITDVGEE